MADITQLLKTGDSAARIDIVFVAEGYQASERSKFLEHAASFLRYFLDDANGALNAPFSTYKHYFNASALFFASAQSGLDRPGQNVDTYFNGGERSPDGRLVYGDSFKVAQEVAAALPANAHELTVVLVNSSEYGGSGGAIPWATTGNDSSAEILLHELGHGFASLEDEYIDLSLVDIYPLKGLDSVHMTTALTDIPWSHWLGYSDELGTVGIYEGGYYRPGGVFRATEDSKMYHLGVAFSAPQKEAFASAYYNAIGDYLALNTAIPGLICAVVPDQELLNFSWTVDGQAMFSGELAGLDLYGLGLHGAGHALVLATLDRTGIIRSGLLATRQTEAFSFAGTGVTDIGASTHALTSSGVLVRFGADDNQILCGPAIQNVYVDGGAGADTLVLGGLASAYSLTTLATGTQLVFQAGVPLLALRNIETIQFSDTTLELARSGQSLTGGSASEQFQGGAGNDRIDGGAGIDTALFGGARASYDLTRTAEGWVVSSLAGGTDTLINVERLVFADLTLAIDLNGNGGQAYRLYQAAFNRVPDTPGLSFWINAMDKGATLGEVAAGFASSKEFQTVYGAAPSSGEIVGRFYANVLQRPGDAGGIAFWVDVLDTGKATLAEVLAGFSDSAENQDGVATVIGNGFPFTPFG